MNSEVAAEKDNGLQNVLSDNSRPGIDNNGTQTFYDDRFSSENFDKNDILNDRSVIRTGSAKTSGLEQAVEKIVSALLFGGQPEKDSDSISIDSDVTVTDLEIFQSMHSQTKNTLGQTSSRADKLKSKSAVKSRSKPTYEDASPILSQMIDNAASKKASSNYKDVLSGINENKKLKSEKNKGTTGDRIDLVYDSLEGAVADIVKGIVSSESALSFESTDSYVHTRESILRRSGSVYEEPMHESLVRPLNVGIIIEEESVCADSPSNNEVNNAEFQRNSLFLEKKNKPRRSVSQKIPSDSERLESEDVIYRKNQETRRDSAGENPPTFQDPSLDKYKDENNFSGPKNNDLTEQMANPSLMQPMIYLPYYELENMIVKVLGNIVYGNNPPTFVHSENLGVPSSNIARGKQKHLPNVHTGQSKILPQIGSTQSRLNYQPQILKSSEGSIEDKTKRRASVGTTSHSLLSQSTFHKTISNNNISSDLNSSFSVQQSRTATVNMPSATGYTIKDSLPKLTHPVKISSIKSSKRNERKTLNSEGVHSTVNVGHVIQQANLKTNTSNLDTPPPQGRLPTSMVSRKVQTDAFDNPLPPELRNISSTSYTGNKQSVRKRSVSTAMEDYTTQSDQQISPSWYRGLVHENSPLMSEAEISEAKLSVDAASNQGKSADNNIIDSLLVRVKVNCPTEPVRIAAADISPCLSDVNVTPPTPYSSAVVQNLYSSKEDYNTLIEETMPDLTPENSNLSLENEIEVHVEGQPDRSGESEFCSALIQSPPPQSDHDLHAHPSTSSIKQAVLTSSEEQSVASEPDLFNLFVNALSCEEKIEENEEKSEEKYETTL